MIRNEFSGFHLMCKRAEAENVFRNCTLGFVSSTGKKRGTATHTRDLI
jgi:hypothetical protein